MSKGKGTISVQCPACEEDMDLEVEWYYDPGGWGPYGGWPPDQDCYLTDAQPKVCTECKHEFNAEEEKLLEERIYRECFDFFDKREEW